MEKTGTIFFLSLFLIFAGCGGEPPKATKVPIPPAPQKVSAPVPAKEPLAPALEVQAPEPLATASYTYNPQGKPNPFQPLVVEKTEAPAPKRKVEAAAKKEGPSTPLERVELSTLKLVALVWDIPKPRAMVEDPEGKGYVLTVGTRIGKSGGRITKITSAGVMVTEKYEVDGKIKNREVPLRLYAE